MSDPATPTRPYVRRDRSPAARNAAQRAQAEIAARECVSEHGKCESVGFLVARRGWRRATRSSPVQVKLLYQALGTSDGAMSDTNLAGDSMTRPTILLGSCKRNRIEKGATTA